MPVSVSTPHAQVRSRDALLQGLAWRLAWPWMASRRWMHWSTCASCVRCSSSAMMRSGRCWPR
jgi:hypothetical protein